MVVALLFDFATTIVKMCEPFAQTVRGSSSKSNSDDGHDGDNNSDHSVVVVVIVIVPTHAPARPSTHPKARQPSRARKCYETYRRGPVCPIEFSGV